jgi:hypothetical protein
MFVQTGTAMINSIRHYLALPALLALSTLNFMPRRNPMKAGQRLAKGTCLIALALISTLNHPLSTAFAQGTAFTYQGRLNNGSAPANGSYDLAFTLFNTNTSGVAVAGPVTNSATAVSNGLFTTAIDFGPGVFLGGSNWLEIAVSTNGANSFTKLAPRQQLTPTPYALYAPNAGSAATATTAASAGSVAAANISGTLTTAQLPAGVLTNGSSGVNVSGTFSGNGAGLSNLNGANLLAGSVGTAQLTGGTLAAPSRVGGTTMNAAANTSYVVTSAGTTSIVLPTTANLGDVIQITGAGAGGWSAAEPGIWTKQTSAPTNAIWTSVASSLDGSHLAAVAQFGGIYTSSNFGVNWTQTSASTSATWVSVAEHGQLHLAAKCESRVGKWLDAQRLFRHHRQWHEQHHHHAAHWQFVLPPVQSLNVWRNVSETHHQTYSIKRIGNHLHEEQTPV